MDNRPSHSKSDDLRPNEPPPVRPSWHTSIFPLNAINSVIEETFENVHHLRDTKGGEYAGDVDALANFRRNAITLHLAMEQVWAVYAAKHWDSIMQYIQDISTGKDRIRTEPPEGRIDDLITYLILLKAILYASENR